MYLLTNEPCRGEPCHRTIGDHMIVPRHICALTCYNRVGTIMSGHKCFWARILYYNRNIGIKLITDAVQ